MNENDDLVVEKIVVYEAEREVEDIVNEAEKQLDDDLTEAQTDKIVEAHSGT